jgi:hypothetical protein
VLQNYFHDRNEQHLFKDGHQRATSIQNLVKSDSNIARLPLGIEFCNTFEEKRTRFAHFEVFRVYQGGHMDPIDPAHSLP